MKCLRQAWPLLTAGDGAAAGDGATAVTDDDGSVAGVGGAYAVVDDEPTLGRQKNASTGQYVSCRSYALWRDDSGTRFSLVARTRIASMPTPTYVE